MSGGALFAMPCVGRAGLGNGLFPWARAEVFAAATGARILEPRWGQWRLGPYLRREPEKRHYGGYFDGTAYVRGFSRWAVSRFGHRVAELPAERASALRRSQRPCVVEFRGIGSLFEPLVGEHALVFRRLWAITLPQHRGSPAMPDAFIAMHVRRGDLTRQGFRPEQLRDVHQYTESPWFASMARAARGHPALRDLPIVVFTDGSADEVREILAVDGVRLHVTATAIADLWTLARAQLLFASGFSTFGMWASYLGRMPTVYAPGKLQQRVQPLDGLELELAHGEPIPPPVAQAAAARCNAGVNP